MLTKTDVGADLHFGWFIPTSGDTSAIGLPEAGIPPSLDMFTRVAKSVESAGFEYALVPVVPSCYEAWISCAMVAAKTDRLKMLVAARPGYVLPQLTAKMVSTFDQLSSGRVLINLIAGGSVSELAGDGIFYPHDERYEVMDETVHLMKRLWTEDEPVTHNGKHFELIGGRVLPRPYQQPHPAFYLGGESSAAREVGAKHANTYLLWGDTPEKTEERVRDIRARSLKYERPAELRFGMRFQVVVRETERQAWEAAEALIAHASDEARARRMQSHEESEADNRMKELAQAEGYRIARHLWSGIGSVRAGAGVAIVGNPEQVANTIDEFIQIGCTEFCLSGYPHDREAERFGELVMPLLKHPGVTPPVQQSAS
jgi:alkanesulfonate monooxygenase